MGGEWPERLLLSFSHRACFWHCCVSKLEVGKGGREGGVDAGAKQALSLSYSCLFSDVGHSAHECVILAMCLTF